MLEVRERDGGSVVALMEVPREQIHLYGCAAVEDAAGADVVRVTGLVEKPPPEDAPSDLAIIGRYVLDPGVFEVLRHTEPGRGGEIQLTDALRSMAESGDARAGARRRLRGPPLRHRRPARLPQDRGAARVRARGPRARLPAWLREFVDGLQT